MLNIGLAIGDHQVAERVMYCDWNAATAASIQILNTMTQTSMRSV